MPKNFQHPRDSQFATQILSSAAAQTILQQLHASNIENLYVYLYQASCPRLTEKTSPRLFQLLGEACQLFELEKIPQVYVTRDYEETVSVRGINEPFIVFSSEFLRRLDERTLFGILAGQVAGILCNHHRILYITWGFSFASNLIPGSSWVIEPVINNWKRCRYFTYDRAFCLATKNRALSLRQVLINIVPQNILDRMNCGTNDDAFIAQAQKFIDTMNNSQTQNLIKSAISAYSYKIWLPERYDEINKFFDEGGVF